MSSIKRIIQSLVVGAVLMQLAIGSCIARVDAQEPVTFPAEESGFGEGGFDLDIPVPDSDQAAREAATKEAEEAAAAAAGAATVGVLIGSAVGLVIWILIFWFLSSALSVVPQQYRDMEPVMVWLLLIPLFNIIWMFFVTARISSSYQRYFAAQGITTHGDCGAAIGLWFCICMLIPCVNFVALILGIIYLVKVAGMKKALKAATAGVRQ
jgi:hypothetical protein